MTQYKFLITVITRNRPNYLQNIIKLILNQTLKPDGILIVDNDSTPDTKKLVSGFQTNNSNLYYLNTYRNAGGAGGQYTAMSYALANEYDALWTMDDDCEPSSSAFEEIVKQWLLTSDKENWMLNSTVKELNSEKLSFGIWHTGNHLKTKPFNLIWNLEDLPQATLASNVFPNWGCLFNGTLIPTSLMRKIGLPRPEFFIRGDEVEYLYRTLRFANVATVLSSIVRHPNDSDNFEDLAKWKQYYSIRNSIIIEQWYFPENIENLKDPIKRWRKWRWEWFLRAFTRKQRPLVYKYAIKDAIFEYFGRDVFNTFKN